MPIHHSLVLFSAAFHLICKLGVLLSNLDLLLQPLLLVVQLAQTIFKHLSLDLLLFELKLRLELARAIQASCLVLLLGRLQIVELNVAKAEVVADKLLGCYFFGRCELREVVLEVVLLAVGVVARRWVDDVLDLGPAVALGAP